MGMMLLSLTYTPHKVDMCTDTPKSGNRDNIIVFFFLQTDDVFTTTWTIFAYGSRLGGHPVGGIAMFFGK